MKFLHLETDADKGIETLNPRPQVLMMVADPILDGLYRSKLQNKNYCIVWCDPNGNWKKNLQTFHYDIIIVDFSFFQPTVFSPENLQEVITLSPDSEIIVLSQNEDVRLAISAFHMGIADYFLKPTNPETLAWAIEKQIQRRIFKSTNEVFEQDLKLFQVTHQLNSCENDTKMRSLVIKNLLPLMRARGGIWALPITEEEPLENLSLSYEFFGGSREEGKNAFDLFQGKSRNLFQKSFESHLTSHPEQWMHKDSLWIPLRSPWMGGIFLYGIQMEQNPTVLARTEFLIRNLEVSLENNRRYLKARKLSYVDDLTLLYNSRYLDIALSAAIEHYKHTKSGFCILFIDIDRFKLVNDHRGHLVGSQLLIDLAHIIKGITRKSDHIFRYGGDEFIVLMYNTDLEEAKMGAERLRIEVEKRVFHVQEREIRITLSIGVACFPLHAMEKKKIIKMADDAMYGGKKSGRNTVFTADNLGKDLKQP